MSYRKKPGKNRDTHLAAKEKRRQQMQDQKPAAPAAPTSILTPPKPTKEQPKPGVPQPTHVEKVNPGGAIRTNKKALDATKTLSQKTADATTDKANKDQAKKKTWGAPNVPRSVAAQQRRQAVIGKHGDKKMAEQTQKADPEASRPVSRPGELPPKGEKIVQTDQLTPNLQEFVNKERTKDLNHEGESHNRYMDLELDRIADKSQGVRDEADQFLDQKEIIQRGQSGETLVVGKDVTAEQVANLPSTFSVDWSQYQGPPSGQQTLRETQTHGEHLRGAPIDAPAPTETLEELAREGNIHAADSLSRAGKTAEEREASLSPEEVAQHRGSIPQLK